MGRGEEKEKRGRKEERPGDNEIKRKLKRMRGSLFHVIL